MTRNDQAAAVLLMLAATTMMPVMDTLSKLLSASYNPVQIAWVRYTLHAVLSLPIVYFVYGQIALPRRNVGWHVLRGLSLSVITILYVMALERMPLANAVAIMFINPLIITALSPWVLGERVGPRRWAAVLVGFGGAVLVIRPGLDFAPVGTAYAVSSAVGYAGYILLTKRLSASTRPLIMLFLLGALGMAGATVAVPFVWRPVAFEDLPLLAGIGFLSVAIHLLVILAYARAEASAITPFTYFQIIGGTVLGLMVFGDFPRPQVLVGIALIIGCGIYIAWRERVAAARDDPPEK